MYSLEITHVDGSKKSETHLSSYLAHTLASNLLKNKQVVKVDVYNTRHELEETYERLK